MRKNSDWDQGSLPPAQAIGDHPHLQMNRDYAEAFIGNCEGKLPNGMNVKICDTDGLKQCLLSVSWHPPKHILRGVSSTPISLIQTHDTFKQALRVCFNEYHQTAKDWLTRMPPKQTETCLESTIVKKSYVHSSKREIVDWRGFKREMAKSKIPVEEKDYGF